MKNEEIHEIVRLYGEYLGYSKKEIELLQKNVMNVVCKNKNQNIDRPFIKNIVSKYYKKNSPKSALLAELIRKNRHKMRKDLGFRKNKNKKIDENVMKEVIRKYDKKNLLDSIF